MRTVIFQSVRDQVLAEMNWEPSVATALQIKKCTNGIGRNVRKGWEYAFWPETMFCEERAFANDWSAANTYAKGAITWDPGGLAYYVSAEDANIGNALTETAWWTPHDISVPTESTIALEQAGKTPIGEVAAIYPLALDAQLDVSMGAGRRMESALGQDGITILGNVLPPAVLGYPGYLMVGMPPVRKTVWVRFRKQHPRFSADVYAAGNNYPAGYVVLWPTTTDEQQGGECYRARQDAADNFYWELQEFPAFLEQYVYLTTMADLLRGESQHERADDLDTQAQDEIQRTWKVQGGQQQVLQRTRFRGCY